MKRREWLKAKKIRILEGPNHLTKSLINPIKRVMKIIKRVKDYSPWEKLKKLGLTTLPERSMRRNLIEIFKNINRITNYSRRFF